MGWSTSVWTCRACAGRWLVASSSSTPLRFPGRPSLTESVASPRRRWHALRRSTERARDTACCQGQDRSTQPPPPRRHRSRQPYKRFVATKIHNDWDKPPRPVRRRRSARTETRIGQTPSRSAVVDERETRDEAPDVVEHRRVATLHTG